MGQLDFRERSRALVLPSFEPAVFFQASGMLWPNVDRRRRAWSRPLGDLGLGLLGALGPLTRAQLALEAQRELLRAP